jgi:hypothetical protein
VEDGRTKMDQPRRTQRGRRRSRGALGETNPRSSGRHRMRATEADAAGPARRAIQRRGPGSNRAPNTKNARTNPRRERWPEMSNIFWGLRLGRRMPTIGHLTTWSDLEEVRRTRDRRGIKRNESSEAAREAERMPFCETNPTKRWAGWRPFCETNPTRRRAGGSDAVLRNEPNEVGGGWGAFCETNPRFRRDRTRASDAKSARWATGAGVGWTSWPERGRT